MPEASDDSTITLFLGGDVMVGRGIDQILPHSAPPQLFEPYMHDARRYVELTERVHGPIPRRADFAYVWGDAIEELGQRQPDARIINLETSITAGGEHWPGKRIHYRMHPGNLPLLAAAKIDICALANNHVLDWGYDGLLETVAVLRRSGLQIAGAGRRRTEAARPAMVATAGKGGVIVFSFGTGSSGIPEEWGATVDRPGVNLLSELSAAAAKKIGEQVRRVKGPGDVVVASIHWGGNWGYDIPAAHRQFAHLLIDSAGIDLVHGHSSHHALGVEVYRGKLILYGCGDLINDYEGISGFEGFHGDLGVLYFVRLFASGDLAGLEMVPMRMRRFRLGRVTREDVAWLRDTVSREGRQLGTMVETQADSTLVLRWQE